MKIVSVVGTRPQLIKAAALQPTLRSRHDEVFVDTGQHWDDEMAGSFFRELGLERPDHSLGAGGGSHAEQTASMLRALEPILIAERPDAVLVYGDTNSTLAGGLAAAKLGIPVGHIEAGLRSFDRTMPEELNRVLVDHLARWLFAPTATAVANLHAEGIAAGVIPTGDLMQDLAAATLPAVRDPRILAEIEAALIPNAESGTLAPGRYLFATIHRQDNRAPAAMRSWAEVLLTLSRPDRPVLLALHPGTRAALTREHVDLGPSVLVANPAGYRASLALQLHAAAVLTDSGGVQRESSWLNVPCLVLRRATEWTEAVETSSGRMVLVGLDAAAAEAKLEDLAPVDRGAAVARARAADVAIESSGTAATISEALGAA